MGLYHGSWDFFSLIVGTGCVHHGIFISLIVGAALIELACSVAFVICYGIEITFVPSPPPQFPCLSGPELIQPAGNFYPEYQQIQHSSDVSSCQTWE